MCTGGGGSPPPAQKPAAAPPPPVDGPHAPELNEKTASDRNSLASNRRGRGSLRINLASGTPSSGGSGLSIPGTK